MVALLNKNRIVVGECIYLLFIAMMVAVRAAGILEGQVVYSVALVVGILLFAAKIIITEHSLREYCVMIVLFFVVGMVYLKTGEKGLILAMAILFGMKGVSVKKVFSVIAMTSAFVVLLNIALRSFGIVGDMLFPSNRSGVGAMLRHGLGYAHPNTLHMNVLVLSMVVIFLLTSAQLYSDRIGKTSKGTSSLVILFSSFLVFCFNIYVYQYSGSRTGLLTCAVFLIFNLCLYLKGEIGIIESVLLYMAYPFTCFTAIILPFVLRGEIFDKVDRTIFSLRLSLAKQFWANNNLSLFGIRLKVPAGIEYGIDMGQLYLLLQLGIAAFLAVSILTIMFVRRAIKKNLIAELAFFAGMMVINIWEPLLYNLSFKNYLYVFMGTMVYEYLGEVKKEDKYRFCIDKRSLKKMVAGSVFGIVLGTTVSIVYLGVTTAPNEIYVADEWNAYSGDSGEILSEDQIIELEEEGAIILGYSGSTSSMSELGKDLAIDEYNREAMNAGVWSGIVTMVAAYVFFVARKRCRHNL